MPKGPRIPKKLIREELLKRIQRQDRGPFAEILADAVSAKPTLKAWRQLAKSDPDKYARSIASMAKVSGFADRSESVTVNMDVNQLAETLINRYGPAKARTMLELHGLPTSLIPDTSAIDGEYSETQTETPETQEKAATG